MNRSTLVQIIAAGVLSVTGSSCWNKAVARLETVEAVDLGIVTPGTVGPFSFDLKNTGNDVLFVKRVSASCRCTVMESQDLELKPGDSHALKGTIRFSVQEGPFDYEVAFATTDPENPVAKVKIMGNARYVARLTPDRFVVMSSVETQLPLTQRIKYELSDENDVLEKLEVSVPSDFVVAKVSNTTPRDADIDVTVLPNCPSGEIELLLITRGTLKSGVIQERSFPVGGMFKSEVRSKPQIVVIGPGPFQQGWQKDISISPGLPSNAVAEVIGDDLAGFRPVISADGTQIRMEASAPVTIVKDRQGCIILRDGANKNPLLSIPVYLVPPKT